MKIDKTLAVAAAAWLATAAHAADTLPAGTLITGQVSGASTVLLGLDHLFTDEPGTNTTALAAADVEFITADAALAVDFFADGRVQVWNNTGATTLPGNYTLSFSFTGLGQPLTSFVPLDTTQLAAGSISLQLISPSTLSLTLTNVSFTTEFGSVTGQVASAVPEPAGLALMAAGLGLIALRRGRRSA
ncbi:MAG: PEP-CTERM sorting domain-containing protein [Burkholderiales bacterium]|nr:MAG: PEP-CTERM sorting domain-containing protein [Burkholderiales bacterium]